MLLPRSAAAGELAGGDRSVLAYALSLEYLQDAFYTEAERVGALTGARKTAAGVLGGVERAHVRAFRGLLGSSAPARPSFDFRGTTEENDAFLRTAVALEDLSVAAYKAQAPHIAAPAVLQAAVGIHSVEARHAAWMRHLVGVQPAANAFDEAEGRDAVLKTVASTRFIVPEDAADQPQALAEVHGLSMSRVVAASAPRGDVVASIGASGHRRRRRRLRVAGAVAIVAVVAAGAVGAARRQRRRRRPCTGGAPAGALGARGPASRRSRRGTGRPAPGRARSHRARHRRVGARAAPDARAQPAVDRRPDGDAGRDADAGGHGQHPRGRRTAPGRCRRALGPRPPRRPAERDDRLDPTHGDRRPHRGAHASRREPRRAQGDARA